MLLALRILSRYGNSVLSAAPKNAYVMNKVCVMNNVEIETYQEVRVESIRYMGSFLGCIFHGRDLQMLDFWIRLNCHRWQVEHFLKWTKNGRCKQGDCPPGHCGNDHLQHP